MRRKKICQSHFSFQIWDYNKLVSVISLINTHTHTQNNSRHQILFNAYKFVTWVFTNIIWMLNIWSEKHLDHIFLISYCKPTSVLSWNLPKSREWAWLNQLVLTSGNQVTERFFFSFKVQTRDKSKSADYVLMRQG